MILLPAGNPSAWTGPTGNNTYLVLGRVPTLIDAGVGNPEHLANLARALDGAPLALVLITHGHVDHASGAPALQARWPDVEIRQFGVGPKPITDKEQIMAGDSLMIAIHTPGHAPDHTCFLAGDEVFCGDLVRRGGTVVIPASRGGDLTQYLESLRTIRDVAPQRLLPGHGPIIDNPTAVIDEYLRHRAEREAQIIDALTTGGRTPGQIVEQIYSNLPSALVEAAAESVLAHLIKLRNEGRAADSNGVWTRRASPPSV